MDNQQPATPTTLTLDEKVKAVNAILKKGEPNNISVDSYAKMAGYDPQYVVDAMNAVFGVTGWGFEDLENEVIKAAVVTKNGTNDMAIAKVKVWIQSPEIFRSAFGQNQVTSYQIGDAKKAAQTDALKKALSYFSVGNRAYHGLLMAASQKPKESTESEPEGYEKPTYGNSPATDTQIETLKKFKIAFNENITRPEASQLIKEAIAKLNNKK